MTSTKSPPRIGILGGGQLARMMALKAHELGYEPHIYSAKGTDPAAQVVRHFFRGDLDNPEALRSFLGTVDLVTFESEFLDSEILANAEGGVNHKIYPRPQTMGLLQDRLSQKGLLLESKLNTLPFCDVNRFEDAAEFLKLHRGGIALKQRRFGYDGYGTFMVKSEAELRQLFEHWGLKAPALIAEPLCKFKRELALSVVRNHSGECVFLPLVQTHQVDSRCKWVKGPIKHRGLQTLQSRIKAFVKRIHYVGIMAFELFDVGGDLIINELAPRVHNSAHYSLDALSLDQFSYHLMALTNAKLKPPRLLNSGFAMVNLLGQSDNVAQWSEPIEVKLHWYGKLDNRPGRKMGHLNAVAKTADEALRLAQAAERKFQL